MALLTIDGLTVNCTLSGGVSSRVEALEDMARSIAGTLLRTQLSSTALASKETLTCTTIPYSTADRDTLITKLESAATLSIAGDIGARACAAVVTSIQPMLLPTPRPAQPANSFWTTSPTTGHAAPGVTGWFDSTTGALLVAWAPERRWIVSFDLIED